MRLKLTYINSTWEAATTYIHFSCFHLCCKRCLRAHRLTKTRKPIQRILGHHPTTLILLGTEPYTIFDGSKISTQFHQSQIPWGIRPSNVRSHLGKHFAQKDGFISSLSSGASHLLGGLPGRCNCPMISPSIPQICCCVLHVTPSPGTAYLLSSSCLFLRTRNLLKAQQIPTETPSSIRVCWDYFSNLFHSPWPLPQIQVTPISITLIYSCSCCYWICLPWSNHFLLFLYPQNHVLWSTCGGSCSYLPNSPSSTPSSNKLTYPSHREKRVTQNAWSCYQARLV